MEIGFHMNFTKVNQAQSREEMFAIFSRGLNNIHGPLQKENFKGINFDLFWGEMMRFMEKVPPLLNQIHQKETEMAERPPQEVKSNEEVHEKMRLPHVIMKDLTTFYKRRKFKPSKTYSGLINKELTVELSNVINHISSELMQATLDLANKEKYKDILESGLGKTSSYFSMLDTEDRDQIGVYFFELITIVGLNHTDLDLDKWRFWFDLT